MMAGPGAERSATTLSTSCPSCSILTPFRNPNTSSSVLWTRGRVPAVWMEVLAAWDEVDPCVTHNSCGQLDTCAESNCLRMFLDGSGGPTSSDPVLRRCKCSVVVLDFADAFALSRGVWEGRRSARVKQTVLRSEVSAGIQVLRFASQKTSLVLISDNEYFASTAQPASVKSHGVFSCTAHTSPHAFLTDAPTHSRWLMVATEQSFICHASGASQATPRVEALGSLRQRAYFHAKSLRYLCWHGCQWKAEWAPTLGKLVR